MTVQAPGETSDVRVRLRSRVTCPHCWSGFSTEDARWVAVHPDLQQDPRLGEEGQRFLPTRFNVDGNALDSRGMVCHDVACPSCHLRVPRPLFEVPPLLTSIVGTPSCGKTYFLASMTWRLRHVLPSQFHVSFSDADPVSNLHLNEYENQQFFNENPEEYVKLAKTEEQGGLYHVVRYGEQVVRYPKPFLFAVRPTKGHPHFGKSLSSSRLLCLYDNAGESFQAGKDDVSAPVTRHLAQSQFLLFCFDPTQDPRLRRECRASTDDPQVVMGLETRRQEPVFHEMVTRIRRHASLHETQKHNRPIIIVVTKYDVWWRMIGNHQRLPDPWRPPGDKNRGLDMATIEAVSQAVRELLWKFTPEIVSAAEAFTDRVVYVPVSATGCSPKLDEPTGNVLGVRPSEMNPVWAEVPMLIALAKWGGGSVLCSEPQQPAS